MSTSVILLGAGASRGTLGEQAPTAKEFGQFLKKKEPDWDKDYPYLADIIRFLEHRIPDTSLEKWALDEVWSAIDNRYKLRYILDNRLLSVPFPPPNHKEIYMRPLDPWLLAGFELKCAVTRIYGTALESEISEAAKGNGTVKGEIEKLQPGDCIISFNYDLLAEEILKALNKKVAIANPNLDITNLNDSILLSKPHGSLSWIFWSPQRVKSVEILDRAMQEDEIDFDFEQLADKLPGIIGPVPFKDEIIFPPLQLEAVPHFFYLVAEQWRSAIQFISEARKLVVLGYGFPREDLHARYMFADAAARRKRNEKLEIELYEMPKRYKEVKKAIDEIFETASYEPECKDKGQVKNSKSVKAKGI